MSDTGNEPRDNTDEVVGGDEMEHGNEEVALGERPATGDLADLSPDGGADNPEQGDGS